MAGETPAAAETTAATSADTDVLEVAAPAEAGKPEPQGDAPKETPAANAAKPESKPADEKKAGADGAAEEGDLLADDEGKTPEKADGPADAKKDETPETYEPFKLPEGVKLDEEALAKATPLFREAKLNQDQAQKLVSLYADMQAEAGKQQIAGFNQIKNDWRSAIKADPEFGGDKLKETVGAANSVLTKFGDAQLRSDLKEWGWANHPGLIKLFARVNAQLSPDTLVHADAGAQTTAPKAPWEIVYGDSMKPKQE